MKHHRSTHLSLAVLLIFLMLFAFSGCGPSAEKIEEAQAKYAELVEIHNEAVEAHKNISDSALDSSLTRLSDQLASLPDFNLNDMKEEQIDQLIDTMDSMVSSYQECIDKMQQIKKDEDAAVLTPILLSLINKTDYSFKALSLYEENSVDSHINILAGLSSLVPDQSITGLTVQRDVDNTPWILSLETEDEQFFLVTLPVETYSEEGAHLDLVYDAESNTISAVTSEATEDTEATESTSSADSTDSVDSTD